MKTLKINHAAVWVCFVLLSGLGFAWYGALFTEAWMEMVGLDMATAEANQPGAGLGSPTQLLPLLHYTYWHGYSPS